MRERLKPTSPNQALERVIQTKHQFMPDITIKTLDEMERYAGPFQKGQDFAAIAVRRSCSAARCISSGNTYAFGVFFAKEHAGEVPQALHSLGDTFDLLLFVAGFLTYLATVAFAASLGRVQWLGRRATRAFMIVNGVALLFLVIRGLQYPDPRALSAPWYTSPGFIVGIPAVPFIMPFLLGVVLLRRAGHEQA